MSKQLTLSATLAVLSMAALALAATFGNIEASGAHHAAQAPFAEFDAAR